MPRGLAFAVIAIDFDISTSTTNLNFSHSLAKETVVLNYEVYHTTTNSISTRPLVHTKMRGVEWKHTCYITIVITKGDTVNYTRRKAIKTQRQSSMKCKHAT